MKEGCKNLVTLKEVKLRAERDAKTHGYFLHPDSEFLKNLIEGLRQNEVRYGYPSCPCRLASGQFELDRDIICPCDYRDPDVEEYGTCYCALYVRKDLYDGNTPITPIPERRPLKKQARAYREGDVKSNENAEKGTAQSDILKIRQKLWYCKQCGYVVFREDPPYICPICQAKQEMFARIGFFNKTQEIIG